MSRRKQRKPQQLISDCEGPSASDNGDASEEDHPQVCAKCCAQFTNPTEFLAHQNACSTEPPVMVIIGGQENPNNSSEPRPEGHNSPQVMEVEHSNPPDPGSSVPTDPTWGAERRGEESAGHFLVAGTGEGGSTTLVEELSMQEVMRKEPGESSSRKACEVCGQTFPTQAALEEHQKTHPKEGPLLTCIFCRQGFLERATLKKHMLLAHHQRQSCGKPEMAFHLAQRRDLFPFSLGMSV
ncbi:Sal-like protein 2 [Myotis davidii]|uniref:Sal-like protein 2 n=1 Tax=Myotis davidii TaxID=225400 RepID=L5LCK7_MYODS|nr:Sal-like protein 2 [Myotis davidii]